MKKKRKSSSRTTIIAFLFIGMLLTAFYLFNLAQKDSQSFLAQFPITHSEIGIDISHHQGKVDWNKLVCDKGLDTLIHFVYLKATEGQDHEDRHWKWNKQQLDSLNIASGVYHFFQSKRLPRPQAAHFLATYQYKKSDLPPVLDIELEGITDHDLIQKATIWLDTVEKVTGVRPIIYTSLHFFETKFKHVFPNEQFWIASYSRKLNEPIDPRIIMWQFSESGFLPGESQKIDLNIRF